MPDYEIRFAAEADMLRVHSRGTIALDILRPELQGEHIPPGRAAAGPGIRYCFPPSLIPYDTA